MKAILTTLSRKDLLDIAWESFKSVLVAKKRKKPEISLQECLMSALAVYVLKFPSLLKYDIARKEIELRANLMNFFHVKNAPSDTRMRERLDVVNPRQLRKVFKRIFARLQRAKVLDRYRYLDDYYLCSIDGTGQYSSKEIFCQECCQKHHRDGSTTYYHQMLGAAIVHPDIKQVIPLAPEPITKRDGHTKNDCELNAATRLLYDLRREHPHLKVAIVEDSLYSDGPHIRLLKSLNMRFILGAKPTDHEFLFDWIAHSRCKTLEKALPRGGIARYKWLNNVPLNDANYDLAVNFLEYEEYNASGKRVIHFSWVTNFDLTESNVEKIMRGGRARWHIENETFRTLKIEEYHFEHNMGHGYQHLCSVFTMLMMLAFLIDEVQFLTSQLIRDARAKEGAKYGVWEKLRMFFTEFAWDSWEALFSRIAYRTGLPPPLKAEVV